MSTASPPVSDRKRFPKWAPASLVDTFNVRQPWFQAVHDSEIDNLWVDAEHQVRFLMITNPRMKGVWERLRTRTDVDDSFLEELTKATCRYVAEYRAIPRRTAAEHKAHFADVAKMTKKLAAKIRKDVGRLSARTHRHQWTRGLKGRLRAASLTEEQSALAVKVLRTWLTQQHLPTYWDVLDDLADELESAKRRTPLLRKPGSSNAGALYVSLCLCSFFKDHFGRALYEHVATIAGVVTGQEIEAESVRKSAHARMNGKSR